mmetsp:Transcript_37076/g.67161  ORF Transcript_37076/g.67161 Transcript_37076/m.67161 type:complete len:243 (+) Transcript_37076:42-770(+)
MASLAVCILLTFQTVRAVRTGLHGTDDFICKTGQGEGFQAFLMTGDRSKKSCAARCDAHAECQSFDFTTSHSSHVEIHTGEGWVDDSCRLYKESKPRIPEIRSLPMEFVMSGLTGKGFATREANGRQYCTLKHGLPPSAGATTTSATTSVQKSSGYSCLRGQGEALKTYKMTGDTTKESCASLCDAEDGCHGFDFKEEHSSHLALWGKETGWIEDSCRLYKKNKPRWYETTDRKYCSKMSLA